MYQFDVQHAYDFARHIGEQTKVHNDEMFFKWCPYCKPKHDRTNENSFSINLKTGQFKCLRASCGIKGNMVTLAKDFDFSLGAQFDEYYRQKKQYKQLKTPEQPMQPKPEAVAYLESRGISAEVAEKYEITVRKDNPKTLVFPFYDENGKLQFVKYRKTDFDKTKDKGKEWCEANCKPILFGMKQCNLENKTLIMCEGQLDSLSVATAGIENATSVPTGANGFTWIPYCFDWVNQFDVIIVFGDYENGKITLLDEISRRFKKTIKHVRKEDYKDCKDANEILLKYGAEQIHKCIDNAVIVPMRQIIQLSDVEDVDIFKIPKLKTGIYQVDRLLYGGLPFGGVVLIGGKAGQGKLLADDTPIFTRDGWKKHGDLVVGDEVIGRYGDFVKVVHVFPKYYANMKLTMNNNEVFYCHENHEWVTDFHSGNGYREKVRTAKEILEWKNKTKVHPARLISRSPLNGVDVDLKVKPYTLGAWLGDGRNRHPDISSAQKDYCIVERIMKDGYDISWQTIHKTTGVIYTGFKFLRSQLRFYDMCYSRKTKEKHIPFDYLIAPIEDRLDLLAGLLDTDGYYDSSKHSYTYATTDIKLKDSFIDLIHTFGWNCYCSVTKAKVSSSGIVGKKDVYTIGFTPIGLNIPCQVKRKQQKVVKSFSKRRTSIKKIEYCNPIQGNCIEVEGGVYCVGKTMIPTHNSTLASQILINAIEQNYKCFAYSGELPNYLFKSWIDFQAAGSRHVISYDNGWGDEQYKVSDTNKKLISEWYHDKCFLYDNAIVGDDERENLLTITENAIMQYGVRVILLDNLMTAIDLELALSSDKYERQSIFVKKLAELALRRNVLIMLVAHKRKNSMSGNENDEISGASDITNLATITLTYGKHNDLDDSQRSLSVSKNRLFGRTTRKGYILNFDEKSRRIYGDGDDVNKDFGWTKLSPDEFVQQGFAETQTEDTPFD